MSPGRLSDRACLQLVPNARVEADEAKAHCRRQLLRCCRTIQPAGSASVRAYDQLVVHLRCSAGRGLHEGFLVLVRVSCQEDTHACRLAAVGGDQPLWRERVLSWIFAALSV